MATINLDGFEVFYEFHAGGNGKMPALLLIHGAAGNHLNWPLLWRQMAGVDVYAIDLPGHGKSSLPGMASIAAYAGIIRQFIKALNMHNLVIAGHSMGGAIAQTVSLQPPSSLVGLILVGTGAKLPVSSAILDKIMDDYQTVVDFIEKYSWGPHTPEKLKAAVSQSLRETSPQVAYGDFLACNEFDSRRDLVKMQMPALIISGEKDKMMPPKFSDYLAAGIPDKQLVSIENAGHYMMVEQAENTAHVVKLFLQKIVSDSGA